MFAYALKRKSRFKNLRRRIQKFFCALNSHTNFDSKYVYMLILASSVTLESPTFKKSTFRNYVILRNRGAIKLQSREDVESDEPVQLRLSLIVFTLLCVKV